MLTHEQWTDIHHLRKNGLSIRELMRHMHLSRNTIRKALRQQSYGAVSARASRDTALTPFRDQIPLLASQFGFNAQHVYEQLVVQGYAGSYQPVRRAVRPLRIRFADGKNNNPGAACECVPGQEAYVYWGTARVGATKTAVRVNLFLMVLGFSRWFAATWLLDAGMSAFLDCHRKAFQFFSGVPNQLFYHGSNKTHLTAGNSSQNVEWHPRLRAFLGQCEIEPKANWRMDPSRAGTVLTVIKLIKDDFLQRRQFDTMRQLNMEFAAWQENVFERQIPGLNGETFCQPFRDEQRHLCRRSPQR